MDADDRRELDLLMSFAPTPGEDVVAERLAVLPSIEVSHLEVRAARERLAGDAEWID
jgi:hypothetical protein